MRRVLHINDYPPDILGGAEVMLARTLRIVADAGWTVQRFTRSELPDARLTPVRYIYNRSACRALQHTLAAFQPDVVHLHNYYHLLSPAILRVLARYKQQKAVRIVMTVHDYHLVCPNSGGNWFQRGLHNVDLARLLSWRYLLTRRWDHRGRLYSLLKLFQHVWHYRLGKDARRVLDCCLCPSRFMQTLLARVGLPTLLLPLPNPPAVERQPRSERLTLVFAGRMEPEKGLLQFLRDWPADPDTRLVLIGDGSERMACETMVRERGLAPQVAFLGRLPHAEAMRQMAQAHVLVQPSLLFENYPLSLLEALTVGTNVLVADYGGMREMVQDAGVGYCYEPHQPTTLSHAWQALRQAHTTGSLNRFDVSGFLAQRSEQAYRDALLNVYDGGCP